MMELRQLKTFQTVATLLSFNRAAEVLNYAQSTVSAQIRALEEELGVMLFDRLGKRTVLTEAGELLSHYAQKMLDIESETLADVRGRHQSQGSLTIRVPQTIGNYFLPPVLGEFRRRFPRVRFDFHTCAFHNLAHELQTGVTDLAFLLAESIQSADLVAEPLRFERVVMVANAGNPLAEKAGVCMHDLSDQPVFLAKSDCGYRMVFERMMTEAKVKPLTLLEFNSVEMLKSCLRTTSGVAVIPQIAIQGELDRGEAALLRWDDEYMETAILMIRHKDKWLSPSLRAFMEIARQVVGNEQGVSGSVSRQREVLP
ncbi:MAG: LysR family transcriptional regulator [Thermodesulfobacteriota bacterium]